MINRIEKYLSEHEVIETLAAGLLLTIPVIMFFVTFLTKYPLGR